LEFIALNFVSVRSVLFYANGNFVEGRMTGH
jgi:hypothetical protein